uniref:Rhamnose binding lectin isoform 2 n=1 Tax=Botryllus schlosseri TaxID=30301 RepID=A7UEB5_BOTSH|nr:rhamnose binding lectin isoform 2 [Botryllus schlosseri]
MGSLTVASMLVFLVCAATTNADTSEIFQRTCEYSTMHVQCPAGKTIRLRSAMYGRKEVNNECPNSGPDTTTCEAADSGNIVAQMCNHENSCDIPASNSVFGDPCVTTVKYLDLVYWCR